MLFPYRRRGPFQTSSRSPIRRGCQDAKDASRRSSMGHTGKNKTVGSQTGRGLCGGGGARAGDFHMPILQAQELSVPLLSPWSQRPNSPPCPPVPYQGSSRQGLFPAARRALLPWGNWKPSLGRQRHSRGETRGVGLSGREGRTCKSELLSSCTLSVLRTPRTRTRHTQYCLPRADPLVLTAPGKDVSDPTRLGCLPLAPRLLLLSPTKFPPPPVSFLPLPPSSISILSSSEPLRLSCRPLASPLTRPSSPVRCQRSAGISLLSPSLIRASFLVAHTPGHLPSKMPSPQVNGEVPHSAFVDVSLFLPSSPRSCHEVGS